MSGSPARARLTFHLICHTHWDREWYLTEAAFRPRLVAAIANVLDMLERDPAARFVADGQMILLRDVLAVVPEWQQRIANAVTARRLEVGPWYVLADELIPTGESLVHNLLTGSRDARALGARMDVLYSPDAFGHPAILPTLAAEFGIDAAVAWRGVRAAADPDRDLRSWRGPDGAAMLLYSLPPAGYEIGAALAGTARNLRATWAAIRKTLVARAMTPQVAVFVGADHHAPPFELAALQRAIAAIELEHDVRASSLGEYFAAVRASVAANQVGQALGATSGELRSAHPDTWVLQGVHATRSRLKRRHGACELLLWRKAGPLAALAEWRRRSTRPALLDAARRILLASEFHDTLCGCSADDVALEQETRFTAVAALSGEITRSSLHELLGHDPDRARDEPTVTMPTLVLWNPAARLREGVVTATVTVFRRDVLVGPPGARVPRTGPGFAPFVLVGSDGVRHPVQVLATDPGSERIDASRHYPDQDEVDLVRIAFRAPPIGGLGLEQFTLEAGTVRPDGSVVVQGNIMRNRFLEVHSGPDGRVDVVDRRTGERYDDVLAMIDERDRGDTYTPGIDRSPAVAARFGAPRVLAAGPLVAAMASTLRLPASGRTRITGRRIVMLYDDSPVLRVRLEFDNHARDHRLRLRVPVGAGRSATAGAAFGFEDREPVTTGTVPPMAETPASTAPAHRYVTATAGDRGMVVLAPGFFEYEWTDHHEVLVTLVRAVGELSRPTLRDRPGHAGWPMPTPGAQEPGRHVVELGLMPTCEGDAARIDFVEEAWEDIFLAPQGRFIRDCCADSPGAAAPSATLDGAGLVFSTCKPAEDGRGVVLRCYNVEPVPVRGRWAFASPIARAARLRADETQVQELDVQDGHLVEFTAGARAIVTVLVIPSGSTHSLEELP